MMTTPSRSRNVRGRETEFLLAGYLRQFYPGAYATNKSAPGDDVAGVGRLSIEAKATATAPLLPALRQAHARAQLDQIPVVIWRPNGYGGARIEDWIVATRVSTFFRGIAPKAGYFLE